METRKVTVKKNDKERGRKTVIIAYWILTVHTTTILKIVINKSF